MVFSSVVFLLIFLPIVFALNCILFKFAPNGSKEKYSNILLLIASLLFYAWGEPVMVLLMMLSILVNWLVGIGISNSEGGRKRFLLILGVTCNLAALGYFKYLSYFVSSVNYLVGRDIFKPLQITLPIGISFFTFQAVSYIADVYKNETKASRSLINVALYISFFPQLIAGPIVKYRDINEQILSRSISLQQTAEGVRRFIYGLAKKVLISNVLGMCVDTMYSYGIDMFDGKTAWIVSLAYTFQIYYDFSGYSDMAIGLGKMFGFKYLENFNYPYMSRSVTEFWRRWHISLGSWFREYVYIPLGGNRKGQLKTCLNIIIVFGLTGMWHGAGLAYVLWGLYHGIFQLIERLGFKKFLDKSKFLSTIYCFLVVNFGWVMFRAKDTVLGGQLLARMIMPWKYPSENLIFSVCDFKTVCVFGCAVIGMGILSDKSFEKRAQKWKNSVPEAIYCIVLFVLSLLALVGDTYNPFIYFQF